MKRLSFIIALLCCTAFNAQAQMKFCCYFDGYWSPWVNAPEAKIYGSYEGFVIHSESEGPWNHRFKFTIDNFRVPDKKQRKKDMKTNRYYEFSGTVEYYTSDLYPTAQAIFREKKGPQFQSSTQRKGRPAKKVVSRAIIRVAPFKDVPRVYNIWYDNVALGIDLNTTYFSHKVAYK